MPRARHYFTDDAPGEPFLVRARVRGEDVSFWSAPGLFSKDRLDTGTTLLLEKAELPAAGAVLDLGCGCGVVGCLVKRWRPDLAVTQSDVTEKAMVVAAKNREHFGVQAVGALSDGYETLGVFDAILVNPPRAAGKAVIERMIREAPAHLAVGGSLQLVAMTNKGGKSYARMMEEAFGDVTVIGRGSGFSVYRSVRRAP